MRDLENPIEFARHRRQSATPGEFLMWQIVRDRQRCKMKFRREHPLGPYTCDFYCAEARLDIECDGKDHLTETGKARDAIRDAWMARHGIAVLRFTNQQLENETQTVIQIIDTKLRELTHPSPPAPLPEDGARGAGIGSAELVDEVKQGGIGRTELVVEEAGAGIEGVEPLSEDRAKVTDFYGAEPDVVGTDPNVDVDVNVDVMKTMKTLGSDDGPQSNQVCENDVEYVVLAQEDHRDTTSLDQTVKESEHIYRSPTSNDIRTPLAPSLGSDRLSNIRSLLPGTPGRRAGDEGAWLPSDSAPHPPSPSPQKTGARGSMNSDGVDVVANACSPGQTSSEAGKSASDVPLASNAFSLGRTSGTGPIRKRTKPAFASGASGFTLIELLVTLVIISVLAAATLPALKNVIVDRKTSVAALEVKAFLDAARARAVARGRPVSVILERLSSRWDGNYVSGLAQSSTANNAPANPEDNFEAYNTCIRITMAETLRSMEFDIPVIVVPEDTASGSSQLMNDNDNVLETCRILAISNIDNRLSSELVVGNEIELVDQNEQSMYFSIKAFTLSGGFFYVAIDNEGNPIRPFGTLAEIDNAAANQSMVRPFANLVSPMSKFRIRNLPRPIASMVTDLPRGSCIDLSLSGLANDDYYVNSSGNVYRDCRREFASDWTLPPTLGGLPPLPQQLRPIYLTFSPSGKLTSVLCNTPQVVAPTAGNFNTYVTTLRRIEPHTDVCLFVGRNDQVLRAASTADLAAAEDARLKPNLMDDSGYWVRISPTSGAVSAAPAQAMHIVEDVAEFRAGNPAEPIGHLIEDSRSLVAGPELTSQ